MIDREAQVGQQPLPFGSNRAQGPAGGGGPYFPFPPNQGERNGGQNLGANTGGMAAPNSQIRMNSNIAGSPNQLSPEQQRQLTIVNQQEAFKRQDRDLELMRRKHQQQQQMLIHQQQWQPQPISNQAQLAATGQQQIVPQFANQQQQQFQPNSQVQPNQQPFQQQIQPNQQQIQPNQQQIQPNQQQFQQNQQFQPNQQQIQQNQEFQPNQQQFQQNQEFQANQYQHPPILQKPVQMQNKPGSQIVPERQPDSIQQNQRPNVQQRPSENQSVLSQKTAASTSSNLNGTKIS
jgi:hypothetical protein